MDIFISAFFKNLFKGTAEDFQPMKMDSKGWIIKQMQDVHCCITNNKDHNLLQQIVIKTEAENVFEKLAIITYLNVSCILG